MNAYSHLEGFNVKQTQLEADWRGEALIKFESDPIALGKVFHKGNCKMSGCKAKLSRWNIHGFCVDHKGEIDRGIKRHGKWS